MNTVFRLDAGSSVGLGHLMRCLVIAASVRESGGRCWFVCNAPESWLLPLLAEHGHGLISICADCWQQDSDETLAKWPAEPIDWLIVDHYALDARWEQRVGERASGILVMDDLADRAHACHVLLDQNLARQASDYDTLLHNDCTVLTGAPYALLRSEFVAVRESSLARRKSTQYSVSRVLISLGGADADNHSSAVLDLLDTALHRHRHDVSLHVVLGAAAPWIEHVRQVANSAQHPVTVHHNVKNMASLMAASDLCIGAAGSSSYERCLVGLPSIAMVVADNQRSSAAALERTGAMAVIQQLDELPALIDELMNLPTGTPQLQAMSGAAAAVVDGGGVARLMTYLMQTPGTHLGTTDVA